MIISIIGIIIAAIFFTFCIIFETKEKFLGKGVATLIKTKQRKNVPVFKSAGGLSSHLIIIDKELKNYSKGTYEYIVNKKKYTIQYADNVKASKMPQMVSIVYLKSIPKIAQVKTYGLSLYFSYAILAVLISATSFILGIALRG